MSFPCECALFEPGVSSQLQNKRTLKRSVSTSGIGLFSGQRCEMRLCPSESGGIVFQRVDLPLKPTIPARLEYVSDTPRTTILSKDGVRVQTIEHLMATLRAYGVDNVVVEISGPEVPIFDGSAMEFVSLVEKAELCTLDTCKTPIKLDAPLFWSAGSIFLIALPAEEMRLSYTLHCPDVPFIGTQFYSFPLDPEGFKREIAPCRTFSIYEEIAPLIEKGGIKGGSIDTAVVIKEGKLLNPDGLRFSNEMTRHKILDLIGDLALIPVPFLAHVIAIRSGHASNYAFAKELYQHLGDEDAGQERESAAVQGESR